MIFKNAGLVERDGEEKNKDEKMMNNFELKMKNFSLE